MKQLTEISTFALFCLVPDLFRVVNEPLESISVDLHFSGNTLAEGDIELIFLLNRCNVMSDFCLAPLSKRSSFILMKVWL